MTTLDPSPTRLEFPDRNSTASSTWPPREPVMEMVADAFGLDTPERNGRLNWKAHKRKEAARRDKRNKLAKAARRRNRR